MNKFYQDIQDQNKKQKSLQEKHYNHTNRVNYEKEWEKYNTRVYQPKRSLSDLNLMSKKQGSLSQQGSLSFRYQSEQQQIQELNYRLWYEGFKQDLANLSKQEIQNETQNSKNIKQRKTINNLLNHQRTQFLLQLERKSQEIKDRFKVDSIQSSRRYYNNNKSDKKPNILDKNYYGQIMKQQQKKEEDILRIKQTEIKAKQFYPNIHRKFKATNRNIFTMKNINSFKNDQINQFQMENSDIFMMKLLNSILKQKSLKDQRKTIFHHLKYYYFNMKKNQNIKLNAIIELDNQFQLINDKDKIASICMGLKQQIFNKYQRKKNQQIHLPIKIYVNSTSQLQLNQINYERQRVQINKFLTNKNNYLARKQNMVTYVHKKQSLRQILRNQEKNRPNQNKIKINSITKIQGNNSS